MTPFLKEVAEDLVSKFGEDIRSCAIVFNNKRPSTWLQKYLAEAFKRPFFSPDFYTIQEFFAESSELKIADPFAQFFTLLRIWNEILTREGEPEMEPAKFYPLARIILNDFSQLDMDLVNASQLFREMENIAEINLEFDYLTEEQRSFLAGFWDSYSTGKQKKQQELFIRLWRKMPEVRAMFQVRLAEQKLTSMSAVYRQLAEEHAGYISRLPGYAEGNIVFVGFNALTKAEERIFNTLQEEGKAIFYFDADSYYLEDEQQEAGRFLRRNLYKTGLVNALGEAKSLIKSSPKTIDVYKTQGKTAGAKILQGMLKDKYPIAGRPEHVGKTAIILADESLLLPVLQTIPSHFDEEGSLKPVRLNVTMGYPLSASSLFGLADIWFNVQRQLIAEDKTSIHHTDVAAFLSHPLTAIGEAQRIRIQEKLLGEQLAEVPADRLRGQKGLFEQFFAPVSQANDAPVILQEIFTTVFRRLHAAKLLKQTEAELFVSLFRELNRLNDTLKENFPGPGKKLEIQFALRLLQKAVQGISVPLAGEPLQGIQVMGLLESRNLDFEEVYILGVNEGNLPQTNTSQSFIPDSIRRAYGLPVIENQDAISAYMFYRLLQRSKKVSLVYNALVDESNSGEPSRFIKQLEYESGYSFRYFDHKQQVSSTQRTAVSIAKDPGVMAVLNKYLNGEKRLSASAITSYVNCPLQFFYKYIACIEEPEEITENLEANNIGSILHYLLETFYGNLMRQDPVITKERIESERTKIPSLAIRAFNKVMFDKPDRPGDQNGMQQVVLAIVAEYANMILSYDLAETPFEILALEKKDEIKFEFKVQGVSKSVRLHGIIDRIDRKNGIIRIVDYKTGSDKLQYSNLEDVFDTHGNKQNKALIQTLFYTYVFEQANGHELVEPNLYSTRSMKKDGVFFLEGKEKTKLTGEKLSAVKAQFLEFIKMKLAELFDENIPFAPSQNDANFNFSPYLILCGR